MQAPPQPASRYDYAYYREVFRDQPMPFAYVDLDLLDKNILKVAQSAGKPIRLASKSIRSVDILRHISTFFGPLFQGIMCYSPREAVYLAEQGFTDLLIGYPIWHEQDIKAIAHATATGAQIILMVDSEEHVTRIERLAKQQGVRLPLCLEIDLSLHLPGLHFGAWRSPLRTPAQVRPIVECIHNSEHVWLDGVMGYEAQIAGVGDAYPGQAAKNTVVRLLKKRSIQEFTKRRSAIFSLIESYGKPLRFVNGGGTGSIATTRQEAVVTEITVGSGFYAPTLFDHFQHFHYWPAAGFAIEIVRRPHPTIYTCLGGGYVASGAAGPEKLPQPYLPYGARLDALEGAGEVQTPIRYQGDISLQIGDPIFMRHAKAGELCERFTHLLTVSAGSIVEKVTTYRGDGQCFI